MKTDFFFVYGTLKVGGHFAKNFDKVRVRSTKAEVNGFDLFDLGPFPCIKPGKGKIFGELHEYSDAEEVTKMMDRIEGYDSINKRGLYLRKRVKVRTENGEVVKANIYMFGRSVPESAKKISSGVWSPK